MGDYILIPILDIVKEAAEKDGKKLDEIKITCGLRYGTFEPYVAGLDATTIPSEGGKLEWKTLERILDIVKGIHERWGVMYRSFNFVWDGDKLEGCHYKWERDDVDD